MNRLFIETPMPNAFVVNVAVHQSRPIEEVAKDWNAAREQARTLCSEADGDEHRIARTVALFKEIANSHGRPCEAIVDQEWTNRMRAADDAMWDDVVEPLRSGRTPWTVVEDSVPRGRETAWWVHPHSGEVIATNAHALAVANQPEKFGLSREKATRLGATNGFNFYDTKAGSPRNALISAATANGWVRVRKIQGGAHSVAVQAHGDAMPAASAALQHLEKRGAKFSGSVMVEDPAHGMRTTLPLHRLHAAARDRAMSPDATMRAVVRAHRVGKVADDTPDAEPHFSAYERAVAAIASEPVVTERMQTTNFRGAEYDHEIERFQPRGAIEGHPAKEADRAGFLTHVHNVFAGTASPDKYGTKPPHLESRASAVYLAHQMAYDNDAAAAVGHLGFQAHDADGAPQVNKFGKPKPDLHAFHRHLMDLVDLHWPQPAMVKEELARTGPVRLIGHLISQGVDMPYDTASRLAKVRDAVSAAVSDPDYGHTYWHPETGAVHWTVGDSASLKGIPYGKDSPCAFIAATLDKYGFPKHRIEAEWSPKPESGFIRVDRPLRTEAEIRWAATLAEDTLPEPAKVPHTDDGRPVHAGRPISLHLFRRTEKAPYFGDRYGQDIEPHGVYWTHMQPEHADKHIAAAGYKPADYQRDTATFRKPLLVHVADDSKTIGWKRDLSASYGKTGAALSRHLAAHGHDAIITHRDGQLGEIVDLRGFNPVRLPAVGESLTEAVTEPCYIYWDVSHRQPFTEAELRYQYEKCRSPNYVIGYEEWKAAHFVPRVLEPIAEAAVIVDRLCEAYGIPSSESGAEPCETGPATAADIAKVDAVVNDTSLPDTADPGKAYVVHWADGRGICAFKRKDQLHPWLKKTGDWAEIISIKHKEPIHGKTKLRVHEDAGPYTAGPTVPLADLTMPGDLDSDRGVVDKDDMATRIRKRMASMRQSNISTTPDAPAPAGDNAPPLLGAGNTAPALQLPPNLR